MCGVCREGEMLEYVLRRWDVCGGIVVRMGMKTGIAEEEVVDAIVGEIVHAYLSLETW
jgi:hypothetical protein